MYAETYSIARHSKVFTAKDLDIRLVDAFPSKRGQRYVRLFAHLCGCDRGLEEGCDDIKRVSHGHGLGLGLGVESGVWSRTPSLPRSHRHFSPRHLAENVVRD